MRHGRLLSARLGVLLLGSCALLSCGEPAAADRPPSPPPPATAGRFDVAPPGSGVTLGGVLFRPEAGGAPLPALVVLHGWQPSGTNGAALVEARARRYSEQGYVALALSMRGWPPSGGADDCGLQQPDGLRMQEALGSAGRPARLLLVPDAAHGFTADQEAVARPVVDEFLATELR